MYNKNLINLNNSFFIEKQKHYLYGKKYLQPNYVWTYFNRNNQTFTELRNI
jgi:hypothetical protein